MVCTARAVAPPACPQCTVSPASLNFGQVVVGETKSLPFTVTNTGGGTLAGTISEVCAPFQAAGSYSLGPGASQTFTASFTPASLGQVNCAITTGGTCAPIAAAGSGVSPPSCGLSRTELDFGTVPVGQSKDLTFDLQNLGGGTLCGSVSESCPDFEATGSYCVAPPAFARVTVRFRPTSVGFQQCTIQPGANCPPVTARGTGS